MVKGTDQRRIAAGRARAARLVGAVTVAAAASLIAATSAQAVATATKTAVPLKAAGYSYQQVAHGAGAGFEAAGFDDSAWSVGSAGFGTTNGTCGWNNTSFIATPWAANSDMLVRRTFTLPASARNLKVRGTVDNDATVFVNGQQIGSVRSGFCISGAIDFTAADSALAAGENLLAVRGHDYGGATYLDQQVTYEVPVYSVCPLYDASKSYKSGAAVPLKLQLCDASGNNLSSSSIRLHATELTNVDSLASGVIEDSGNANPEDDFRYDAALGGTGGYVFNKSTKGLTAGTWKLAFSVDGDTQGGYALLFDVR